MEQSIVQSGTIVSYDPQLKAGYIESDDHTYVYFTRQTVLKDIGLGVPREDQRVQFVLSTDPENKDQPVATQVTVLPGKAYKGPILKK